MAEIDTAKLLEEFSHLPRFPDGRINYAGSARAAVLTCHVKCADEILMLKRSDFVGNNKGAWTIISGYIDEPKPLRQKVLEELAEETGITESGMVSLKLCQPYAREYAEPAKTLVICPALAEFDCKPEIKLNWEHTEYKWMQIEEVKGNEALARNYKSLLRVL